jgi:hypothetical protein
VSSFGSSPATTDQMDERFSSASRSADVTMNATVPSGPRDGWAASRSRKRSS